MTNEPTYNLGVDVGGTFTDVIVFDQESKELTIDKVLSTPENPSNGVVTGVEEAMAKANAEMSDLELLFHGTTVATNMILEEDGAKVGLLATDGHEQILHLARAWTPGPLYGWINFEKPDPLADLHDTRGISARLDAEGEVVHEVDEGEVLDAVQDLYNNGIESLTISLVNSYLDPRQEEEVRDMVSDAYPDLPVSISAEIVPEYGEYERTLTTVMNDYVRPQVNMYLNDLEGTLTDMGMQGTMNVVRSDGGTMSPKAAGESPVNLALSGPSGGVVGSANLATELDIENVLTLDMGGTSTDVSLVEDGEPRITRETEVGYRSFKARAVDITTVGAGGGSIARTQITGSLEVGPESAGADPGPACYGRGGTDPTVTDANVVLGRIPSSVKLGGTMELDRQAAVDAIQPIADERGSTIEEAAQGILDIVNQNMLSALRVVSVEQGYDPREFGLIGFGGAGPMHANALGELIDAYPVIIPPGPGVMSAFGFLTSDIQNEFSQTYIKTENDVDGEDVHEMFKELEAEATAWLKDEGVEEANHRFDYIADCRYYRQDIQMSVDVDVDELLKSGLEAVRDDFEDQHDFRFGFTLDDVPLELANLRVIGRGTVDGVEIQAQDLGSEDPSDAQIATETVHFDYDEFDTPVYNRTKLEPGNAIDGPAIVIEDDSTIVIQPDHTATVEPHGCLLINGGNGA